MFMPSGAVAAASAGQGDFSYIVNTADFITLIGWSRTFAGGSLVPDLPMNGFQIEQTFYVLPFDVNPGRWRLQLEGINVPNTDATFREAVVDFQVFQNVSLLRSAATYNGNVGGNSQWEWDLQTEEYWWADESYTIGFNL